MGSKEQAKSFACVQDSNAGAMFREHAKQRGGAQTKLFGEKVLVEGEIPARGAFDV